jgi:2-(1,2-epoxy-1,2-dihydrophenyl)acetyl-CoA isomerase
MQDYETLKVHEEGGVLEIRLNRPQVLNALNRTLKLELQAAMKAAARQGEVRVVLLTGEGRGFCSGQDLGDEETDGRRSIGESLRTLYNPLIEAMLGMPKPIVAEIQGVAAGAGMSLALAADMRLMGEGASFVAAFSRIGLVPDSGLSYMLPRHVGLGRAMEIAMLAEPIPAREALALGLCNHVHPAGELHEAALAFCRRLADGPARALGLTKKALQRGVELPLREALQYEAALQELAGHAGEYVEGVAAFKAKRKPVYRSQA